MFYADIITIRPFCSVTCPEVQSTTPTCPLVQPLSSLGRGRGSPSLPSLMRWHHSNRCSQDFFDLKSHSTDNVGHQDLDYETQWHYWVNNDNIWHWVKTNPFPTWLSSHVLFNKTLPDSQIISTIGYGKQAWICMYLSRLADMPVYRLITDQWSV